jgi:hypothetical protein
MNTKKEQLPIICGRLDEGSIKETRPDGLKNQMIDLKINDAYLIIN